MMEKQYDEAEILRRCKLFDENYAEVRDNIAEAAKKSGRNQNEIQLLAATKTVPFEVINYAVSKGITLVGENRAQELEAKYENLTLKQNNIHFIGSLQTNKVSHILDKVCMIESVNSEKLASVISAKSIEADRVTDVLVEVNIGLEESKTGIMPSDLNTLLTKISSFSGISVKGLMAIPPICENIDETRKYFSNIYKVFIDIRDKNWDNVSMQYLSMGMSHDYIQAIEEGANIVRVGSRLFGERNYKQP